MAQTLSSPGVSISVEDESFYTVSTAGTIPLIFVASASNKLTGSGTGFAPGTLAKNDGKVYLLTSQKDLVDTFGTPIFKTDSNNNPIHAGEQNEYGLQAAYSYLGVSNRAFVARASVDLSQLNGTTVSPTSKPVDGAVWLDTSSTHWGIFEWNSADAAVLDGQTFKNIVPLVITDTTQVVDYSAQNYAPKPSVGATGSYAIVAVSSLIKLWYKKYETHSSPAGTWVEVGSPEWIASRPTVAGMNAESTFTLDDVADSITINGHEFTGVSTLAALVGAINALSALTTTGVTAAVINNKLELYSTGIDIDLTGTYASTKDKLGVTIYPPIYKAPALQISAHTSVPLFKRKDNTNTVNNRPTGSVWIKTTAINSGCDFIISSYKESAASWIQTPVSVYSSSSAALAGLDSTGGGLHIAGNTLYVKTNETQSTNPLATFTVYRRSGVGATRIESAEISPTNFPGGSGPAGDYSFTISESVVGSASMISRDVSFHISNSSTNTGSTIADEILSAINTSSTPTNVHAVKVGTNKIAILHDTGGEIEFQDMDNTPISLLFSTATTANFYTSSTGVNYVASLWTKFKSDKTASFITPSPTQPVAGPLDGQLWYDSKLEEIDIMVHNGTTWVAYRNFDHGDGLSLTDVKGPLVTPTRPVKQSDGSDLVNGDLWIDTTDHENYPTIYKFNGFTKLWVLVDKADQSTENGVLFADARWNTTGKTSDPASITALLGGLNLQADDRLAANFLDFDAPNPTLYPKGMLLWNLRRSGFNVKKYHKNYVNTLNRNTRYNNESMSLYYADRWVSEAANNEDGSGAFGRIAQRKVVVQSLQALVNKNQQIRDEEQREFNLIATPGYPELVGEMKILNYDRGITAFVLGDTPARLPADATSLSNWGNNAALAVEDSDRGLTTSDPYLAFFYPWGYTSDNIGNNIVVPPSHMMLRTIALSDNVSYPWFAPAGTSRGVINNATMVGYVDGTGEFQSVALNGGQRDTLANVKINPLTFITGSGLVNFGQYTRSSVASSLDRINVARLVIYLRRKFAVLSRPYLFQPNDDATRKQIAHAAESMLLELMGQRAIYDFKVVCDKSNNTPARIDRSELWLDVAIEPTKAVEFIYIPLRLKNTGEIKGLG